MSQFPSPLFSLFGGSRAKCFSHGNIVGKTEIKGNNAGKENSFFNENASSSNDYIYGADGNDSLWDYAGDDQIIGWDRNDDIHSLGTGLIGPTAYGYGCYADCGGNDNITGDAGKDSIYDCGGNNNISGGGDGDWIDVDGCGSNFVDGGDEPDHIHVFATGTNTVLGGGGSDFIETGCGSDTVDGGSVGDTIVDFSDSWCWSVAPNNFFGGEGPDCIINPAGTTDGGDGIDSCGGGATTVNCESTDCSACDEPDDL